MPSGLVKPMLKAFWLGPGMTRLKANSAFFCHLSSEKEYPYE